jgi:hypothetical protein
VEGDGLNDLQRALLARAEDCFERLDDVVSELIEVHGVSVERIIDRVHRAVPGSTGGLGSDRLVGHSEFRC